MFTLCFLGEVVDIVTDFCWANNFLADFLPGRLTAQSLLDFLENDFETEVAIFHYYFDKTCGFH